MTYREVFDAVQAHAKKNYNTAGWDSIVECVDFADFQKDVEDGLLKPTVKEAIRYYEFCAKLFDERRQDTEF